MASLATIGFPNTAFAGTQIYNAQLSGDQEVPPVQTTASGTAELRIPLSAISSPQATVEYTVNVTDIQNVTAAHIHLGKMGENGDIVVTLCKAETCSAGSGDGGTNGALSLGGTFNATNLEGPMAGKQIEDLANNMTNGGTYINVHTQLHPNGEIRGQITGGTQ